MPEQKKAVTPRLRFPEFRDAGPWEVKRVGYFLTESRIDGSTGDIAKKLTVKLWGGGVVSKNEYLPGSPNTKYYRRKAGQFIYSKLDFLNGAFGIIPYELDGYESTLDLPAFDFTKAIVPRFFLEYVRRPQFYKKHGEQADGSRKAKRIQVDYFLDLYVAVPCLAEQQKIADCLSSLDELIELQAKQLEALQAHKKGLMQQLFPREGETTPRLRFPEFRDAGPWEYRKLERHLEPYNERVPASGCNLPIYTSSRDGLISQKDYFDGRELINEGEYGVVPPGYFVYRHMSDDATFKFNLNNTGGSIAVSKEYPVFTTHAVVDLFLLFLLNEGEHFKRFAATQRKGGTRTRLYFATLCSCSLPMPSIPEQQKIAECLSSLDELIELQAKKLEALQTHKKGLMQQLFPQEIDL